MRCWAEEHENVIPLFMHQNLGPTHLTYCIDGRQNIASAGNSSVCGGHAAWRDLFELRLDQEGRRARRGCGHAATRAARAGATASTGTC